MQGDAQQCVSALLGYKVVSCQQDYKDLCNIVAEGHRVLDVCMCACYEIAGDIQSDGR